MRKRLLTLTFAILLCSSYARADKIYLKSGEILEGKVKEDIDTLMWGDFCKGDDKVEAAGRCLTKNDIERVEKILRKPEGVALLAKDNMWGVEKYGLQTQVLPISEEFIIGKPMIFAV
ncbi:MAG: hypothetical protein KC618_08555, partial [Candidatus Omnitrophica bacterium]|nr:hypothetical protein [Candidatus Omnitrophota bacterium]